MITMAVQNCNLVDVVRKEIISDVTVIVEKDKIKTITEKQQSGGNVIDLRGAYLLPGLINVHNNLSLAFPFRDVNPREPETITAMRFYTRALKAAREGVTTIRTVGEMHRVDIYIRNLIKDGAIEGPTIFAGGKGLGATGGHGAGFGMIEADGPAEFLKMARRELALGADHLKIFVTGGIAKSEEDLISLQMTEEEIKAVVTAARSKGTYVAAHIGGSDAVVEAVKAGVTCIEHGYLLNKRAVEAIKEIGGYLVPTLSVTRSPEWMRSNGFEEWSIEKALSIRERHSESFLRAFNEGVTIVCGTDLPPADSNNGVNATVRELEFMVDLGIPPSEALRSATVNAARLCGADTYLGVIKSGYQADFIAVPHNPLKDIRSLENIELVVCRGKVMKSGY